MFNSLNFSSLVSAVGRCRLGSLWGFFSTGRCPQPLRASPAEEEEEEDRDRGRESCQAAEPHGDGGTAAGVSGGLGERTRESGRFIKGLERGSKLYLKLFISHFKVDLAQRLHAGV